jgi:antitoxin component HigA of HigAB toxin-antitoxin module
MADVKPIRTEADYEAAIEALEGLWGAKSGTPRGDRLDVLATLIEAYEERSITRSTRQIRSTRSCSAWIRWG